MKNFEEIGTDIGSLVERKNAAYGSSFAKSGDFLRLLFPDGLRPEQFDDALLLVRDFDKSMRIATNRDALGENPWQDKAGYAILGVHMHQQQKEGRETWHGTARVGAEEQSREPNASAAQPAPVPTTASERNSSEPNLTGLCRSQSPNTSASPDASAPTAMEAASASSAAQSKSEPQADGYSEPEGGHRSLVRMKLQQTITAWRSRNARLRCATCDESLPVLPWLWKPDKWLYFFCSGDCTRFARVCDDLRQELSK